MNTIKALNVVLNEKLNKHLVFLTKRNQILQKKLNETLAELDYITTNFNIFACECDNCKEKIYINGDDHNIDELFNILRTLRWEDLYLITDKELQSFFGKCPNCS